MSFSSPRWGGVGSDELISLVPGFTGSRWFSAHSLVDWVENYKIKVAMNRMFNFMYVVKVILVCCGSTWSQPVVR